MKNVRFITRADDAGSSHSANAAIERCIRAGFIKNVSVMAPGAFVREAADMFAKSKEVCFGMHATLNAEWDKVKWGPVSKLPQNSGLVDARGMFSPDPKRFEETKPDIGLILREFDAQLEKLRKAGFDIQYADTHMLPEIWVQGLDEALEKWADSKGLLYHMYYYSLPPGWEKASKDASKIISVLRALPQGQYFYLAHPAQYSEEMLQTGNARYTGEEVAKARGGEADMLGKASFKWLMRLLGIRSVRYDEAVPGPRLLPQDLAKMLGG